ncbi:GGDEF domain-containing protein [Actinoplanes bogorensis]|uniref:GGDEF domain-containing protein n=1 Tax=Paractinoplanes bogorensis TaxID=1610840 RepID=A0ABS5Z0W4_9ACTN|nr:GGDEF domain-containing protein [Actinoplanes bogorensis]MBU2669344.1 GGDEF domain-containing protein [Actinoplanes bogorensis]
MLVALCVAYAVTMAGIVVAAATQAVPVDHVTGPVMIAMGIVAVVWSVRAARDRTQDAAIRRTWWILTAAQCLALSVPLLFLFLTGARPFPQPGDAAHMAFALTLFVALQSHPLPEATRRERWKAVLDSITVALGASMVLWYIVIGPALAPGGASVRVVIAAAAYPVVDLLVLFAFARVLMRGTDRAARRPLLMLGTGVFALFVGDAYLGYSQAHETLVVRTPWQFACWLTMHWMLASGAVEQGRRSRGAGDADLRRGGLATKLPYIAIGIGYALMAVATVRQGQLFPWTGLVLGSMGITAIVVVRQMLAQNESDEAASTDALTGIANRARLHRELASALYRAGRAGRAVGVLLIDLNGFKPINDTLGHQAGDQLLVAVAEAMRRAVRGDDLAGRLGGDEFAVILRSVAGEDEAAGVARRISEALTPLIGASIGVAVSAPGADSPDDVLHRADVAMYHAKRRGEPYELWHDDLEVSPPSAA